MAKLVGLRCRCGKSDHFMVRRLAHPGLRRIRARTRDGYIPVLFRRVTHPRERRGAVLPAHPFPERALAVKGRPWNFLR